MKASLITAVVATLVAAAQGAKYPALPIQSCTSAGCTKEATSIVLDYRWKVDSSKYAANGISISGDSLKLALKDGQGPRVYLASGDSSYKMFKMVGKELSYDVDTSELACNMNGALYFIQMPASGAADGTGYCDANCVGGTCCPEMDIWEANKYANAMTVHASGSDSGGCGLNPFAKGMKTLYGAGSSFSVDTTKPFTVVTQFVAGSSGSVSEIRRIYKQNGKSIDGGSLTSSCNVAGMGEAMKGGSVLAFSIWASDGMQWLDAGSNGPCPTGTNGQAATVTFSNIRYGDIGSTTSGTGPAPQPTVKPTQQPQPQPSETSAPQPTGTSQPQPQPSEQPTEKPTVTVVPRSMTVQPSAGSNSTQPSAGSNSSQPRPKKCHARVRRAL